MSTLVQSESKVAAACDVVPYYFHKEISYKNFGALLGRVAELESDLKQAQDQEAVVLVARQVFSSDTSINYLKKLHLHNFKYHLEKCLNRLKDYAAIRALYVDVEGHLVIRKTHQKTALTAQKLMEIFIELYQRELNGNSLSEVTKLEVDDMQVHVSLNRGNKLNILLVKPSQHENRVLNVSSACFERLQLSRSVSVEGLMKITHGISKNDAFPEVDFEAVVEEIGWMATAHKLAPYAAYTPFEGYIRTLRQVEVEDKLIATSDLEQISRVFSLYTPGFGGKLFTVKDSQQTALDAPSLFQIIHRTLHLFPDEISRIQKGGIELKAGRFVYLAKRENGKLHLFLLSGQKKIAVGASADIYELLNVLEATFCIFKRAAYNESNDGTYEKHLRHEIKFLELFRQHPNLDRLQDPPIATFDCPLFCGYVVKKYPLDFHDYVKRVIKDEREGKINVAGRMTLCDHVMKAVQQAWSLGVHHADISCQNFFVESCEPLKIKLADFGLATSATIPRDFEVYLARHNRSPYDAAFLSRAYDSRNSEEIARADIAQDIFMVGVVFCNIFAGVSAPYSSREVGPGKIEIIRDASFRADWLEEVRCPKDVVDLIRDMTIQRTEDRITKDELCRRWEIVMKRGKPEESPRAERQAVAGRQTYSCAVQ